MTINFSDEQKDSIIGDYTNNNICLRELGKKYNTSQTTIQNKLKLWDVKSSKTNYHKPTRDLMRACRDILESNYDEHGTRMTVRQVYYRIISHFEYNHLITSWKGSTHREPFHLTNEGSIHREHF